jgi:hypothetical protein
MGSVRKTAFLSHFYIKCIILPRQARDKIGKTQKKSGVSHNSMHSSSAGGGSTVNDEEHSGSHKQQNLSKTVSDKTSQDLITAMCFVLCSLLCRVEELSTRLGEALISSGRE